MISTLKTSWAWALLFVAIAAWGAGGWWAYQIDSMVVAREVAIRTAAEQQAKETAALKMRSLLAETVEDRSKLATLTKIDVVEAAKQIESAGVPSGVKFHVRDAVLEPVQGKTTSPLQPVVFSVEAEGTFVQLIRALALLRSMPFPLQISQLDLNATVMNVEKKSTTPVLWHATMRVRLLTTAPLSS